MSGVAKYIPGEREGNFKICFFPEGYINNTMTLRVENIDSKKFMDVSFYVDENSKWEEIVDEICLQTSKRLKKLILGGNV